MTLGGAGVRQLIKLWARKLVLLFLIMFPFFFLFVKLGYFPRSALEAITISLSIMILICTLSMNVLFFIGFAIIFRSLLEGSLVVGFFDIAAIGLLLYYTSFSLKQNELAFALTYLISIEFFFGIVDYVMGNTVDYNRYSGIFPGSLHYGYSSIGLAIALFFIESKYKSFLYLLLMVSAVLSGSRSSFMLVAMFSLLSFIRNYGFLTVSIVLGFLVVCSLERLLSLRALSYVEQSDTSRLDGYLAWAERLDVQTFLFGSGRYYLGSVGAVNNLDKTVVTESSLLTYLEGYGIIIGAVFLLAPYIFFFKKLDFYNFSLLSAAFFLASGFGPFFETPSILFLNTILILSSVALHSKRKINLLGAIR